VCGLGWPSLHWFVTENLSKPPKDWLPPARPADSAPAYVEVGFTYFFFGTFNFFSQETQYSETLQLFDKFVLYVPWMMLLEL